MKKIDKTKSFCQVKILSIIEFRSIYRSNSIRLYQLDAKKYMINLPKKY